MSGIKLFSFRSFGIVAAILLTLFAYSIASAESGDSDKDGWEDAKSSCAAYDVNQNGCVNSLDSLPIINALGLRIQQGVEADIKYDVNKDRKVTSLDAQLVISCANNKKECECHCDYKEDLKLEN